MGKNIEQLDRCKHGVWAADHCYECAKPEQPDDLTACERAFEAHAEEELLVINNNDPFAPKYAPNHGAWEAFRAGWCSRPKRESGWVFITFDEKGSIRSTPAHEQEVLFVYGESVYAGCFLDDIRESHYPDGEKYEGDFGFYTNDDKFFEAEHVRCWMPSPIPPKTDIEDAK